MIIRTCLFIAALIFISGGLAFARLIEYRDNYVRCSGLQKLKTADAIADARAAHARKDDHLIMLGGYVGVVPGIENDRRAR